VSDNKSTNAIVNEKETKTMGEASTKDVVSDNKSTNAIVNEKEIKTTGEAPTTDLVSDNKITKPNVDTTKTKTTGETRTTAVEAPTTVAGKQGNGDGGGNATTTDTSKASRTGDVEKEKDSESLTRAVRASHDDDAETKHVPASFLQTLSSYLPNLVAAESLERNLEALERNFPSYLQPDDDDNEDPEELARNKRVSDCISHLHSFNHFPSTTINKIKDTLASKNWKESNGYRQDLQGVSPRMATIQELSDEASGIQNQFDKFISSCCVDDAMVEACAEAKVTRQGLDDAVTKLQDEVGAEAGAAKKIAGFVQKKLLKSSQGHLTARHAWESRAALRHERGSALTALGCKAMDRTVAVIVGTAEWNWYSKVAAYVLRRLWGVKYIETLEISGNTQTTSDKDTRLENQRIYNAHQRLTKQMESTLRNACGSDKSCIQDAEDETKRTSLLWIGMHGDDKGFVGGAGHVHEVRRMTQLSEMLYGLPGDSSRLLVADMCYAGRFGTPSEKTVLHKQKQEAKGLLVNSLQGVGSGAGLVDQPFLSTDRQGADGMVLYPTPHDQISPVNLMTWAFMTTSKAMLSGKEADTAVGNLGDFLELVKAKLEEQKPGAGYTAMGADGDSVKQLPLCAQAGGTEAGADLDQCIGETGPPHLSRASVKPMTGEWKTGFDGCAALTNKWDSEA
jgi:hypothetical protein